MFSVPGWFSIEQSKRNFENKSGGLDLRLHIDEFEDEWRPISRRLFS